LNDAQRLATYPTARSFPMTVLNKASLLLLIVGGLNWGLVGLVNFDLVAAIFGDMTLLSRVVYSLVGLSALWQLISLFGGEGSRNSTARA